MSNLVRVTNNPISTIVRNQLAANVVVGFTAYMTACVLAFHDDKECSKAEMLTELYSASYATWKWYMGLGPKPEVKIGIEDERRKQRETQEVNQGRAKKLCP